jgi:acetolactate synthase-1/2/3 large subunit
VATAKFIDSSDFELRLNRSATDFAKVAEGLGCEAITVTTKEEVAPAIEKAIACGKPVLLNCIIDKDDCVFPMVPAGAAISDAFDAEDLKNKNE